VVSKDTQPGTQGSSLAERSLRSYKAERPSPALASVHPVPSAWDAAIYLVVVDAALDGMMARQVQLSRTSPSVRPSVPPVDELRDLISRASEREQHWHRAGQTEHFSGSWTVKNILHEPLSGSMLPASTTHRRSQIVVGLKIPKGWTQWVKCGLTICSDQCMALPDWPRFQPFIKSG